MTDIPKVEEMLQINIFLYDIDFVDGELIGELGRRSIQKIEKSVKLLRYNNHICFVSDMNSFFKSFCCSSCDTIFSKTGNLERHLITYSDRVTHKCNWWELYRTDATVKNHLRSNFPYQRPLSEERLMQEIKSRRLFGCVQCDLKVSEHLKAYFANFPPILKNTVVSRNDIGDLTKEYAEKEGIMSQPRRMLISSFHLEMELSSLPYYCITCIWVLN